MSDDLDRSNGEAAVSAILSQTQHTDRASIVACPHGHVHVIVEDWEVTLTPADAEEWVAKLYDYAQEAKEKAADTEGEDQA